MTESRHEQLGQKYCDALRAGCAEAAVAVVDAAVQEEVPAPEIQTEIIQPALVRFGELWADGTVTVADEHLASEITLRALTRLVEPLRVAAPASREKVLVAAVAGERHVIGARMVADVLAGAGFDVRFLGADVPTDALVAAVAEDAPRVTGLSCTCAPDSLAEALAAIAETSEDTRVVIGGAGVPEWLRASAYPWVGRSTGVVGVVEALLDSPPQVAPAGLRRHPRRAAERERRQTARPEPRRAAKAGVRLTPRQMQVLRGLADGKSTDQIARELFLTPVTVRNHIANILGALGVHSRLQAVVAAGRRGLIE